MIKKGYKWIQLECDECGEFSEKYNVENKQEFTDAMKEARSMGWFNKINADGEWHHLCCFACKSEFFKK